MITLTTTERARLDLAERVYVAARERSDLVAMAEVDHADEPSQQFALGYVLGRCAGEEQAVAWPEIRWPALMITLVVGVMLGYAWHMSATANYDEQYGELPYEVRQ